MENDAAGDTWPTDDESKDVYAQKALAGEMEWKYEKQDKTYGLIARHPSTYNHLRADIEDIVLTQHSIKKYLELFGTAGAEAVVSKMNQAHYKKVAETKILIFWQGKKKRPSHIPYDYKEDIQKDQGPHICIQKKISCV